MRGSRKYYEEKVQIYFISLALASQSAIEQTTLISVQEGQIARFLPQELFSKTPEMALNAVYKKEQDSADGSLSPGLSQREGSLESNRQLDGGMATGPDSLVDIFIQNSKPMGYGQGPSGLQGPPKGFGSQSAQVLAHGGPSGPMTSGPGQHYPDMLHMQPPSGENSQMMGRGFRGSGLYKQQSGSFSQLQRERQAQKKQEKINDFIARQTKFEKKKERNLKKLTREQIQKERTENSLTSPSHNQNPGKTGRNHNNQAHYSASGRKVGSTRGSSSKKLRQSSSGFKPHAQVQHTVDSFDGVKDGVANRMHCDPHSTTSNLALQTISFPPATNSAMHTVDANQYLSQLMRNGAAQNHPLLQQMPSGSFLNQADYYKVAPLNPPASLPGYPQAQAHNQLPKPYLTQPYNTVQPQPQHMRQASTGGRPLPPHLAQEKPQQLSMAFGAAMGLAEEVLDEFPVPQNVHVGPRPTDISIEQKSFLQMQNAINQSSRFEEGPHGLAQNGQNNIHNDSQNVTNIMMQALSGGGNPSGPRFGQGKNTVPGHHLNVPGHHQQINEVVATELSQVERFFNGAPSQKAGSSSSQIPSRIGSIVASQHQNQLLNMHLPHHPNPPSNQALETTQIIHSTAPHHQQSHGLLNAPNTVHKTHSLGNFQQSLMTPGTHFQHDSSHLQYLMLQNALAENNHNNGVSQAQVGGNNFARDIDILDSEFAQEESRQIEAYYRSVHKESSEKLRRKQSQQQPRRSSKKQKPQAKGSRNKGRSAGLAAGGDHSSLTERKVIGVSRLDTGGGLHPSQQQRQGRYQRDNSNSQNVTVNRSQLSRGGNNDSQRSSANRRQVNAKAIAQAKEHLQRMQKQKALKQAQEAVEKQRKRQEQVQKKQVRDELYLSNKLTRQFIMVTSLVMQSEDLSEDSIFNYAQYTEFAIRFGLMSERAASEESDERALLYEMWCTLSRVHSDFAFIRVVNLKTMITAILGFPVAVHKNPMETELKKRANRRAQKKAQAQAKAQAKAQAESEKRASRVSTVQEGPNETEDSEFNEADDEDVPMENNFGEADSEMRASRQPINIERSAGKSTRDAFANALASGQSYDSSSAFGAHSFPNQLSQNQQPYDQFNQRQAVIDEYEELRAAENGQLSPETENYKQAKRVVDGPQNMFDQQNRDDDDSGEEEQRYFFDKAEPIQDGGEGCSDYDEETEQEQVEGGSGQGQQSEGEGEETSQNEYAIDRAHRIGFFVDHFEFCMSMKDVRTVQRRFKLFQKNWREFQKKDLVVKKSVIVDDGATFKPRINKKSDQMIRSKEMGNNIEFPLSNDNNMAGMTTGRSDQRSQRRQKIWERELPRGVKSKERIYQLSEFESESRGDWLLRTEQNTTSGGLPFYQTVNSNELLSREQIMHAQAAQSRGGENSDYFAYGGAKEGGGLGRHQQVSRTYASLSSQVQKSTASMMGGGPRSESGARSAKGPRPLTNPQMTKRMEHIYQLGKHKILMKQQAEDKAQQEFEKQSEQCTFKPQISAQSKQIVSQGGLATNTKRSFSRDEKPWSQSAAQPGSQTTRQPPSQQQLAERMQLSIQKDILRQRQAQRERQIKDKVIKHGGWRKDYERQLQQLEGAAQAIGGSRAGMNTSGMHSPQKSHEVLKPAFKTYELRSNGSGRKGEGLSSGKKQSARRSQEILMREDIHSNNQAQSQQQLRSQRYPMTTNTSRSNLQARVDEPDHHGIPQTATNKTPQMFEARDLTIKAGSFVQGESSQPGAPARQTAQYNSHGQAPMLNEHFPQAATSTAIHHSKPPSAIHEASLITAGGRNLTRDHSSAATSVVGGVREQTPSRGMGVQNSAADERGGLPLGDSQTSTSLGHNTAPQTTAFVQSSHKESNERGFQASATHNTMAQNPHPDSEEQLTVIQETTFEQTLKRGSGAHDQHLLGRAHNTSRSTFNNEGNSQYGSLHVGRKPLLFIEVDTNGADEGGVERIEVYKGDDPRQLAVDFCRKHDYDEGTQIVLQRQIEDKLARAYAKLEAKMQEKRQNRLAEKFREKQTLKAQK